MKAIELNSKTDIHGNLILNYALNKKNKDVKILLLLEDDILESDEEEFWLKSISNNPALIFLNEPEENVYTLKDDEPINEK